MQQSNNNSNNRMYRKAKIQFFTTQANRFTHIFEKELLPSSAYSHI